MPVIYSDKLIFYREDSSERNVLANTLTKSDEWIYEKECWIVINDDTNMGKIRNNNERFCFATRNNI